MKKFSGKVRNLGMVVAMGMMLTACGSTTKEAVNKVEKAANNSEINTVVEAVVASEGNATTEALGIIVVEEGKEYNVNEMCKVAATFQKYNIQVPVEQIAEELIKANDKLLELKSHTVVAADSSTDEAGKYDAIDTIQVTLEGPDAHDIMPQKIKKTVEYKREAISSKWIKVNEYCNDWELNHKKFGGTAWKMSTEDGDVYLRFRDTIEFFHAKVNPTEKSTEKVSFDTTILGAIATEKDGNVELKRIHIMTGTVSADGIITLTMVVDEKEEKEVILNDFERIEKSDLPFTEEEYKEVADQR